MSGYKFVRDELTLDIREAVTIDGAAAVGIALDGGKTYVFLVTAAERVKAAQALAGDGYEVVEKIAEWERVLLERQRDDTEDMQRDLGRILTALGLGTHARPASPHEVVLDEVLPAIEKLKAAEPDRREPIDPVEVRVGDVVEVTHVMQGEVYQLSESGDPRYPFHLRGYGAPAMGNRTTVRVVSRPAPEPDPEQVEEWIAWLEKADAVGDDTWVPVARELTRAGVPIPAPRDGR